MGVRITMKVLAIIPAYNEEESIVRTVDELNRICPLLDYIVVNDGSHDHTRSICRKHGYNLVDLPANVGLTGGFQTGVKYALSNGYDAVLQFDADGQHVPVSAVLRTVHHQNPIVGKGSGVGKEIVIGDTEHIFPRLAVEIDDGLYGIEKRIRGKRVLSCLYKRTGRIQDCGGNTKYSFERRK